LNLQPGLWLPAYIYSEESKLPNQQKHHLLLKAQTRFWGYDLQHAGHQEEFTDVTVEAPAVEDQSHTKRDASPVEAERDWSRLAEQNVLERLEKAGLLARPGEVDKILATVINNLEVTNGIDIQPPVRARVLLTTPLESFTVGHTVIVSRGLLDVLPDEATLATVLAHELAHITLGHRFDTEYAFNDRLLFPDEATLRRLDFHRNPQQESDADQRALKLLQNSPYKDKLPSAGLFLSLLKLRSQDMPNLIRAHLGNSMYAGQQLRLGELIAQAPALAPRQIDQLPALPLGSRIRVNPWNDQIELTKNPPVRLNSPEEKMSFELTPMVPYLTRPEANVNAQMSPQR
jgi:hypothetical protein